MESVLCVSYGRNYPYRFCIFYCRIVKQEIAVDWIKIDRDENGFATDNCLEKIFNNLPCAVCSQTEGGYKYYNMVGEYFDMLHNREDLRTNTGYTHYLPIPKLEL